MNGQTGECSLAFCLSLSLFVSLSLSLRLDLSWFWSIAAWRPSHERGRYECNNEPALSALLRAILSSRLRSRRHRRRAFSFSPSLVFVSLPLCLLVGFYLGRRLFRRCSPALSIWRWRTPVSSREQIPFARFRSLEIAGEFNENDREREGGREIRKIMLSRHRQPTFF